MNALPSSSRPNPTEAVIAALSAELVNRYGERAVTSMAVREQHGHSLTWAKNQPPDVVVYARTTDEVSDIVKLCAAHDVPVVPFGTGTSLEGHINAPFGGVSVDVSLGSHCFIHSASTALISAATADGSRGLATCLRQASISA